MVMVAILKTNNLRKNLKLSVTIQDYLVYSISTTSLTLNWDDRLNRLEKNSRRGQLKKKKKLYSLNLDLWYPANRIYSRNLKNK